MEIIKEILTNIEFWIASLGNALPIEIFAAVGSLVEEIIAPIPSPLVMTLAGSILESQKVSILYALVIGAIAAVFKTIAQWGFYVIADKTEDIATSRFSKLFGFSHKDIENVGKHFKGGIRDDIVIILTRALPILPSAVVSVAAGFIKIERNVFLRSSLIGNYIRSLFFLYFGYYSYSSYESLSKGISSFEDMASLIFVGAAVIILIFVLIMRRRVNKQQPLEIKKES